MRCPAVQLMHPMWHLQDGRATEGIGCIDSGGASQVHLIAGWLPCEVPFHPDLSACVPCRSDGYDRCDHDRAEDGEVHPGRDLLSQVPEHVGKWNDLAHILCGITTTMMMSCCERKCGPRC